MTGDLPDLLAWLDGHWNMEARSLGVAPGASPRTPTLDRMRALLDISGNPQSSYPVLHITGTNGKTSTARILSSLLVSAGLAVGTTTSPHLERINERITGPPLAPRRREKVRRQHDPIPDADLADQLRVLRGIEGMLPSGPGERAPRASWFELVTACAFRWFADVAVDAVVAEVGMGGRWDATNVADGQVAVITTVGLDHVEYLGPTLTDIAAEKAGIIKPGAVVVVGERDPGVVAVVEERAAQVGADRVLLIERDVACDGNELAVGGRLLDIRTPWAEHHEVFLPLHGHHQGHNAALAVAAAEAFLDAPLADDVVAQGFDQVTSPGRLEILGREPLLLLDGAHNVQGMTALGRALDEEFPGATPIVAVVGVLEGHDPGQLLDALGSHRLRLVVACPAPSPRTLDPSAITAAARQRGIDAVEVPSVAAAVEAAQADAAAEECILVTGSLYVVGAARGSLS